MGSEKLDKELEVLDREAGEVLNRLADKREERERRLRATELAAATQREREEARRREQAREAKEREERHRAEELERLGKELLQLEERAEKEAETLRTTLEELLAVDRRHRQVLAPGGFTVYDAPPDFAREFGFWFRVRFGEVVPGIGVDFRTSGAPGSAGPSLPERDPLTDTTEG